MSTLYHTSYSNLLVIMSTLYQLAYLSSLSVVEDPTCVLHQLSSDCYATGYWPTGKDLSHHLVLSRDLTMFFNCVLKIREKRLIRVTIL